MGKSSAHKHETSLFVLESSQLGEVGSLLLGNGGIALLLVELLAVEALGGDVLLGLGGVSGVLADGLESLLVDGLDVVTSDTVLDELYKTCAQSSSGEHQACIIHKR